MKFNKTKIDQVQLEYLVKAEKLQAELIKNGFLASRIEKGEDRTDFKVIFFDGEHDYIVRRDYNDNISIVRSDWPRYKHVSTSRNNEVYKNIHKSNNVKVITQKKLQTLLDEVKEYHGILEQLNEEIKNKNQAFLETLEKLPVEYHREDYQNPKSDIKSGEIIQNGIIYEFEIFQDGYISQKISIDYRVNPTIENFLKLSDNNLKKYYD